MSELPKTGGRYIRHPDDRLEKVEATGPAKPTKPKAAKPRPKPAAKPAGKSAR